MTDRCMVCGGPVIITPRLFPEAPDRWDCPQCGTWGITAYAKTVREKKR